MPRSAAPGLDRRHRRQPPGRLDRKPVPCQHPRGGYAGPVYAVQQRGPRSSGTSRLREGRRDPRTRRPCRARSARGQRARRRGRVRREGGRYLLVASAGFAESGADGTERQEQLRRRARENGLRVVGPNSFGPINTDPEVLLNASLAPRLPGAGGLGLFAQSGALGIAVLASADRRGLGVSDFASRATASTSPATTSCSTGSTTTTPPPWASTSSRSATRASSPGSPAAWPSGSR